jgi:hypothetical protein
MAKCPNELTELKCWISCANLVDAGLTVNVDYPNVKVRAKNSIGLGEWSNASDNNSIKVTLKPDSMVAPDSISKTGDSITITWSALDAAATNG